MVFLFMRDAFDLSFAWWHCVLSKTKSRKVNPSLKWKLCNKEDNYESTKNYRTEN